MEVVPARGGGGTGGGPKLYYVASLPLSVAKIRRGFPSMYLCG